MALDQKRYLYYYRQEELLHFLNILNSKFKYYDAERIYEEVNDKIIKYVAFIKQSIEALKKKEITVLFEPIASGYYATPQFTIARKNESVAVDIISKPNWFGFKRKQLLIESIKIKDLRFKQEGIEIEQEQIGEYLFLYIP